MRASLVIALFAFLTACSAEPRADAGACDENTACRDSDCDTICDRDELGPNRELIDTDDDGTPDHLDDDSDGDGLLDRDEAGDTDPLTPPIDSDNDGVPDFRQPAPTSIADAAHDTGVDAPVTADSSVDAFVVDATTITDAGDATAPLVDAGPMQCEPADIVPEGCVAEVNEGVAQLCDSVDNDCDGQVDEGCNCVRGSVQGCFAGPPGRRRVGACSDGTQQCMYLDEFSGRWGPCTGGIVPSSETCDGLDNDCNGCRDEIDECQPAGSCPGPGDPRVPTAKPFETYTLRGSDFYDRNDVRSWRWRVNGPPCDRMFASLPGSGATATNGRLSYSLRNAGRENAELDITLSGAYEVTLTVTRNDNSVFECTWIVDAKAPGVRVELCWPNTGATALSQGGAIDLDLHVGKTPETAAWFGNNDCYWRTCGGANTPWTYTNTTPISRCTGPLALNYTAYQLLGYCPSPRLDIDNRDVTNSASNNGGTFVTENINIDAPGNNHRFRVLVDYFANALSQTNVDGGVITPIDTEPLVNVYCGGTLAGTFGGNPDVRNDPDELSGFNTPGQQWRVVDIQTQGSGNNVSCTLTPLTATGTSDYDVRSDDTSY